MFGFALEQDTVIKMVNLFLFSLQGEFETGKYKCLICKKEFNSESGVKYHINSIHSQVTQYLIFLYSMLFIDHKNIFFNNKYSHCYYFTQDWFVVRSKSKSSKLDKLNKTLPKEDSVRCPDLSFPQVPSTWQDRQTSAVPMSSGTATPGRVETKRKEGQNKQKEKESRQEKDCYEFSGSDSPSSSSSSESSSSESEAEDSATHTHDKWALSRPLTKQVASQQPGSDP